MEGYDDMRHEKQTRYVDTFVVLDLDRTLLDSDKLVNLVYSQLSRYGVSNQQVETDKAFVMSKAGHSMPVYDYFAAEYPDFHEEIVSDVERMIQNDPNIFEGLLHDGARELIDILDEQKIPFAIMTYGEKVTQRFKLRVVASLTDHEAIPALITSHHRKAEMIGMSPEWSKRDGIHIHPDMLVDGPVIAKRVIVIDDKHENTNDGGEQVQGIQIDNTDETELPSISDIVAWLKAGHALQDIATAA